MKNIHRIVSLLIVLCMAVSCFVSCTVDKPEDDSLEPSNSGSASDESESTTEDPEDTTTGTTVEQGPPDMKDFVDYVSQLKLDMSSDTMKQEVTVKTYVDGDTTHFNVPKSISDDGVLKARYLAIDTPESTGKIEEWGKRASRFTKEKLSNAVSIMVESDTNTLNPDSTGSRFMVWVWYKTDEEAEYRNLNLEILQNGLAIGSNAAGNRYGKFCTAAIAQASKYKLFVHSNELDPDYPYGSAAEVTLSELRYNIKDYDGKKVAFDGVITKNSNNTIYVEMYDEATGIYNGMSVYLGFNLPGKALEILEVGNLVRIVGSVQYYEAGETYQVAGLSYQMMKPQDPDNVQLIETGHSGAFPLTDPKTFVEGKVTVYFEDEEGKVTGKEYSYNELVMSTTISMNDLKVTSVYTTNNGGSSDGAMTLTCTAPDGTVVKVRTDVIRDADGNVITEDAYKGKVINVKGIVDYFGGYQIRVLGASDITIK